MGILEGALELNLRQLRVRAASAGVSGVKDMSKEELIAAMRSIVEEEEEQAQKDKEELELLRQRCVFKGLSTHGSKEELLLRLERAKEGAISEVDNNIYRYAAMACGILCVAAMGISIFHISAAIQKIMQIGWIFSILFAIVIDGCVVCFKVIDSISKKFDIGKAEQVVRGWIVVCLVMSAALNSTSFMEHADTLPMQVMAVFWACFISLVIWGTSYVSMQMLTKREVKGEKESTKQEDMPSKLRMVATKYEEIGKLAEIAHKILGG